MNLFFYFRVDFVVLVQIMIGLLQKKLNWICQRSPKCRCLVTVVVILQVHFGNTWQFEFGKITVSKHIKDYIRSLNRAVFFELKANFTIDEFKSILIEPYFVVEGIKARILFNNLKRIQEHSAIIIDEVRSASGYVTLEDLIEEMTGDIFDDMMK